MLVLPGQPIPLPRGPMPQLGSGVYVRDGHTRASLVGIPRYEGSVGDVSLAAGHLHCNIVLDAGHLSRPTSPTVHKLDRHRLGDAALATAGHACDHCRRRRTTARWRGVHGCHPRPRCEGDREGQGEDRGLLPRWGRGQSARGMDRRSLDALISFPQDFAR